MPTPTPAAASTTTPSPTTPSPALLDLPPLHFAHPGEPALFSGLALQLGAGLHWLHGDAGSGKTTLLRLLAGDLPGLGEARLQGQALAVGSAAWQARVCWLDVRDAAFDDLTAEALMRQLGRRHPGLDRDAWQRHIGGFGLAAHAAKTMSMLSTGMRRKAALAAMLASGAPLLLLDEPTAGLDGPSTAWLVAALNQWAAAGACGALVAAGAWPAGLAPAGRVHLPGGT